MTRLSEKITNVIKACKTCQEFRKHAQEQLMGMLLKWRVNVTSPFTIVGIDYAGPFFTKIKGGRRAVTRSMKIQDKTAKAYICLFICLTTKAIHLELVSDLTTCSFTKTFSRFTSRRGVPALVLSDNGTTFKGAVNKTTARYMFLEQVNNLEKHVANDMARQGMKWKFIPPYTPHYGGLWEANIKQVKYHLKRIVGENVLTFEDFTTVLNRIEAVLNSRLLCPRRSMEDVITPAHFLIHRSFTEPPANPNYQPLRAMETFDKIEEKV